MRGCGPRGLVELAPQPVSWPRQVGVDAAEGPECGVASLGLPAGPDRTWRVEGEVGRSRSGRSSSPRLEVGPTTATGGVLAARGQLHIQPVHVFSAGEPDKRSSRSTDQPAPQRRTNQGQERHGTRRGIQRSRALLTSQSSKPPTAGGFAMGVRSGEEALDQASDASIPEATALPRHGASHSLLVRRALARVSWREITATTTAS